MQITINQGWRGGVLKTMTVIGHSQGWLRTPQENQLKNKTLAYRPSGCFLKSIKREALISEKEEEDEQAMLSNQGTVPMLAEEIPAGNNNNMKQVLGTRDFKYMPLIVIITLKGKYSHLHLSGPQFYLMVVLTS